MYQGDRPGLTEKINLVAQRQRASLGRLATDVVGRSAFTALGDVVTGHGPNDPQAVPLGEEGMVLTAAPGEAGGVRWAGGFPGPTSGTGITFAQIFGPGGRFQVQVFGTVGGDFHSPAITSVGVFGVPDTGLTGSFDRVSWDFTADISVDGFSHIAMLEPGFWSLFVTLIGLDNGGNPTDVTLPWSFGRVALPFFPGSVLLKVPPIAPITRGHTVFLMGYSQDSFAWSRPVADLAGGAEVQMGLHLNETFFSQHQLLGELLWVGPLP